MSDSRLEKFIYAICSMDVSDLPVPLSRIEKLWNCLITGETPDFEPLSRNEKYLMAMLDRYDISNLPAPMSRGEKLLYKIAVGETDLSDVPGYLSRYEELLKYLIKNGGISGGDFEYVLYTFNQSLYTLYTTAEKPVKKAIIYGDTLVNTLQESSSLAVTPIGEDIDAQQASVTGTANGAIKSAILKGQTLVNLLTYFMPNVDYMDGQYRIRFSNVDNFDKITIVNKNSKTIKFSYFSNGWQEYEIPAFNNVLVEIPKETNEYNIFALDTFGWDSTNYREAIDNIVLLHGDYANQDIPYFEGMQSVKLPVLKTVGKNLVSNMLPLDSFGGSVTNTTVVDSSSTIATLIEVGGNITLTVSKENKGSRFRYFMYRENPVKGKTMSIGGKYVDNLNTVTFTTQPNTKYLLVVWCLDKNIDYPINPQIEYGNQVTPYEPYKSNILTVNEDVTLRGIGDVKDELNCLTGEVTERIGENVFDGSDDERWEITSVNGMVTRFSSAPNTLPFAIDGWTNKTTVICDKLISTHNNGWAGKTNRIYQGGNKNVFITKAEGTTLDEFKEWLSQNPITVQYQLATESIKTVDLTTVDQDNQPTKLGTFENVTHVSLESAGLIPEVEMEVATNLLEDTVFNLTNTFNTLYPTAEKPVVDGTLYGQTLVNLATQKSGRFNGTRFLRIPLSYILKSNTNYFVNFTIKESTLTDGVTCRFRNTSTDFTVGALNSSGIITVNTNMPDTIEFYIENTDDVTNGLDAIIDDIMVIEYQDGMENWDIPYFEGIQSVQAPGVTIINNLLNDSGEMESGAWGTSGDAVVVPTEIRSKNNFICFPEGLKNGDVVYLILSDKSINSDTNMHVYNHNKDRISTIGYGIGLEYIEGTNFVNGVSTITIHDASECAFFSFRAISTNTNCKFAMMTKKITLSTPSDLTLRKVGEVQDEVNVMTGEVVERIGEIVIDNNEYFTEQKCSDTNYYRVSVSVPDLLVQGRSINDKLPVARSVTAETTGEFVGSHINSSNLHIRILSSRLSERSIDGVKAWLSQNPITVQYQLATPTTKTVDLSIVNQDGNETKLRTFDDTTHVLLNSEGVPMSKASLTVRTKIPSGSSTSVLMDELSTEQQQLSNTVDEQSNNVDATMIATTEIYEGTL